MTAHKAKHTNRQFFEQHMTVISNLLESIRRFKFTYKPFYPHGFMYEVNSMLMGFELVCEARAMQENDPTSFLSHPDMKADYEAAFALLTKKMHRWMHNVMVEVNLLVPKYPTCLRECGLIMNKASRLGIPFYVTPSIRNELLLKKLSS